MPLQFLIMVISLVILFQNGRDWFFARSALYTRKEQEFLHSHIHFSPARWGMHFQTVLSIEEGTLVLEDFSHEWRGCCGSRGCVLIKGTGRSCREEFLGISYMEQIIFIWEAGEHELNVECWHEDPSTKAAKQILASSSFCRGSTVQILKKPMWSYVGRLSSYQLKNCLDLVAWAHIKFLEASIN